MIKANWSVEFMTSTGEGKGNYTSQFGDAPNEDTAHTLASNWVNRIAMSSDVISRVFAHQSDRVRIAWVLLNGVQVHCYVPEELI